ncbi:MAG: peptidylprolyl isomerase [Saprospiraceae bacterium]|nr:peptidylprolyl isomerase [Saprospiraceae bacterium]
MKKLILFLSLAQMLLLFACSGGQTDNATGETKSETAAVQTADGSATLLIETTMGNIKVKLFDSTPEHKKNFLKLAKEGYLDNTLFHRVMPGFMIQGGDPDSKTAMPGQPLGQGGPGYTLPAEIGAKHFRGALSAARLPDQVNPEKRSSGSQFYIVQNGPIPAAQLDQILQMRQGSGVNYSPEERDFYLKNGGYPPLDGDYTVFGQVTEGMEVVDKIANAPRDPRDRPLENISMKVKILSE